MAGPGFELIGKEEEKEVLDVLRSKWLFRYGDESNPDFKKKVITFEKEVCEQFGVKYSLAVSTGTAALLTSFAACEVGPGDEVIVPGYTFIASIASIIISRAIPVLAEVDTSLTLDPEDVKKKITPHTKAILVVHMLGAPCKMKELKEIADENNLLLVEDTCQAFGGSYNGKRLGTIGKISATSFNIFKTINAGDGGMVYTNDHDLYVRSFGYHDQGHFPGRNGAEIGDRALFGQDFRMNELTGAVLLAQVRKIDVMLDRLRAIKLKFKNLLKQIDGVEFREINDEKGECATSLVIFLPSKKAADIIAEKLGTVTISKSDWHVYSNMEQLLNKRTVTSEGCPFTCQYYKGEVEYKKGMLPFTDNLLERAINLSVGIICASQGSAFGVNITSTDEQISEMAQIVKNAVDGALK